MTSQGSAAAWVQCAEIGCPRGIAVHHKHAPNFEGRRWACPDHDPTTAEMEPPC